MGTIKQVLPVYGYRQIWSESRNILVQVFTDLETDSIALVTIDQRTDSSSAWESLTQVRGN